MFVSRRACWDFLPSLLCPSRVHVLHLSNLTAGDISSMLHSGRWLMWTKARFVEPKSSKTFPFIGQSLIEQNLCQGSRPFWVMQLVSQLSIYHLYETIVNMPPLLVIHWQASVVCLIQRTNQKTKIFVFLVAHRLIHHFDTNIHVHTVNSASRQSTINDSPGGRLSFPCFIWRFYIQFLTPVWK